MLVRETELRHHGVKGMKWGHRKNKYGENGSKRTEKLLKDLMDYDKKINSRNTLLTNQVNKYDKLAEKYDKSAAKDIKKLQEQGNTKAAKSISAGRTYVRMTSNYDELANAITNVALKANVKIGADFTYSVLRDSEYGGVKITVNNTSSCYEYLGEGKYR